MATPITTIPPDRSIILGTQRKSYRFSDITTAVEKLKQEKSSHIYDASQVAGYTPVILVVASSIAGGAVLINQMTECLSKGAKECPFAARVTLVAATISIGFLGVTYLLNNIIVQKQEREQNELEELVQWEQALLTRTSERGRVLKGKHTLLEKELIEAITKH